MKARAPDVSQRNYQFMLPMLEGLVAGERDTAALAIRTYDAVLRPHHSWAFQQMFKGFLRGGVPSRGAYLAAMGGGGDETAVLEGLRGAVAAAQPLLAHLVRTYDETRTPEGTRLADLRP